MDPELPIVDPLLLPVELAKFDPPPLPNSDPESHQGPDELPLPLDETEEEPIPFSAEPIVELLFPDPVYAEELPDPAMGPVKDPMLLPELTEDPAPLPPNIPPESHQGPPVFTADPVCGFVPSVVCILLSVGFIPVFI